MEEDTVVALPRPGSGVMDDPLLAVLREGARRMLTQAIAAEVEAFLAAHARLADEQGRRRLVRNGHAPERRLQTGIGPLEVPDRSCATAAVSLTACRSCHARPRSPWSSSSSSPPSGTGAGSRARSRLAQVIEGVLFRDGEPIQEAEDQAAADTKHED